MTGAERIAAERARQVATERWDDAHDDRGGSGLHGPLGWAAAYYAAPDRIHYAETERGTTVHLFPWDAEWNKRVPDDEATVASRVRDMEKAGALCAAEIDRLLRLQARGGA